MTRFRAYILALLTWGLVMNPVFAQLRTPVAYWLRASESAQPQLRLNLIDYATEKQRKLIDSGFTTYSEISVLEIKNAGGFNLEKNPIRLGCTIKYDAWEEHYEVTRIEKGAQTLIVPRFSDYAQMCLSFPITDAKLNRLLQNGSSIVIKLQMNQVSPEKTQEIKKWLVRQQSGVMQGIFSHMLGDLKLSENVNIKVIVPRMNTVDAR